MFYISVTAVSLQSRNLRCRHNARKVPVFAVILVKSAAVRTAVRVKPYAVKSCVTRPDSVFAQKVAEPFRKLGTESRTDYTYAGIIRSGLILIGVVFPCRKSQLVIAVSLRQPRRSVLFHRLRLDYRRYAARTLQTHVKQLNRFVPGKLV